MLNKHLARDLAVSSIAALAEVARWELPIEAKFDRERQMLLTLRKMCDKYFEVEEGQFISVPNKEEMMAIVSRQLSACAEAGIL